MWTVKQIGMNNSIIPSPLFLIKPLNNPQVSDPEGNSLLLKGKISVLQTLTF